MLLKLRPSRARERTLHAATGVSAATAWTCLAAGAQGGGLPAAVGFWIATVAALSALRASSGPRSGPHGEAFQALPSELDLEGVTSLLMRVRGQGCSERSEPGLTLWCDAVSAQTYRRLAALGRWRRVGQAPEHGSRELIGRGVVTNAGNRPRSGCQRPE